LHDLMIPSEEQEYQGHSYHFSLQSVSPSNPKPQSFSDEKLPHEESSLPKRKGKSKMHTCTLCKKSFPRPSGLRTHMNSHSGDKRVSCCVSFPKSADTAFRDQLTSVLLRLVPSLSQSVQTQSAISELMAFIWLKQPRLPRFLEQIARWWRQTRTLNALFAYAGLVRTQTSI
jgi:uncharacterized Zn-finger protein